MFVRPLVVILLIANPLVKAEGSTAPAVTTTKPPEASTKSEAKTMPDKKETSTLTTVSEPVTSSTKAPDQLTTDSAVSTSSAPAPDQPDGEQQPEKLPTGSVDEAKMEGNASTNANETANDADKPDGGGGVSVVLIVIVVLLLLLAGAGAGGYYYFFIMKAAGKAKDAGKTESTASSKSSPKKSSPIKSSKSSPPDLRSTTKSGSKTFLSSQLNAQATR